LNILWQNEHYPDPIKGGGGAVNTFYIVRAMESLGHDVEILARGSQSGGPIREEFKGTKIIRAETPRPPDFLWPIWQLLEPYELRKVLNPIGYRFDAFFCIDAPYALSLKRLYPSRPLIFRVEGTTKGHNKAVSHVPLNGTSLSEQKRRLLRKMLILESDLVDRVAWRRCDAIVVKSEFMKNDLISLYRVPRNKIHIIPNGVDFVRYANVKVRPELLARIGNADRNKVVIAFAGRLVRMKNVPYLLAAFARMRERKRCMLIILGEGDQRDDLERLAGELSIAEDVKFVGHADRVEDYLAVSDIFVLPSTYEPFGNALIEAMAAGLPCIALRPDFHKIRLASTEILDHGQTGFLVDPADASDLAVRLDELAADPSVRRRIGQAAQKDCQSKYDWDNCARAYLDLTETLMRDKASFQGVVHAQ
jgi:glycosyltransferase involved in cell wall biosynthesis